MCSAFYLYAEFSQLIYSASTLPAFLASFNEVLDFHNIRMSRISTKYITQHAECILKHRHPFNFFSLNKQHPKVAIRPQTIPPYPTPSQSHLG